jgi:hypothetical protein
MQLKNLFIFMTAFLAFSAQGLADGGPLGVGLILANPTGFSGKYRMSKERSIDAALGYSLGRRNNISLHSTYIWEFNQSITIDSVRIGHYFGVGGALYSRDNNDPPPSWAYRHPDDQLGLAVRGLAGLNYYFKNPAIEIFAESALNFFFVPSTRINLGLAIGGRYFF